MEFQEQGRSFYQDDKDGHQVHGRGNPGCSIPIPGQGRSCGQGSCQCHGVPGPQAEENEEENYQLEEEYEDEVGRPVNNHNNNSGHPYSVVPHTNTPISLSPHTSVPTTHGSACVAQSSMSKVLFNICTAEQIVLEHHTLPARWLLLDSCSTIDVMSNASLHHNIHCVKCPTWVHCNARQVQLDHQGYPVWCIPKGVANILSLNNVANNY
jgi:hypothetical protein